MVNRPAMPASGLKLRAAFSNRRLPCRSPTAARTRPTSVRIARSSTYSRVRPNASNGRSSFGSLASATDPSAAYRIGMPPSETAVPAPVAV